LQLIEIPDKPVANDFVINEFRRDAHCGQWRAQIMPHRGEQSPVILQSAPDPFAHRVESIGRALEILRSIRPEPWHGVSTRDLICRKRQR
jgi:hypothetical protein